MPFCRVIVAGRMPLSLPFFDYTIPKELENKLVVGQLVSVPFRGKENYAVIHSFPTEIPFKNGKPLPLKTLSGLVNPIPAFSTSQLDFLMELAEFYAVSPGFIIKSALFEINKKNKNLFQNLEQIVAKQRNAEVQKPVLAVYETEAEKKALLTKNLGTAGQKLILVPEVHEIEKTARLLFGDEYLDHCTLLSSNTKPAAATKIWLTVWQGKPLTMIATRRALFLPWNNLQTIWLLDEGNSDYKSWDMAPRFETRDAVFFLSKHHLAQVHLMSHTPSVESFFFAKKQVYSFATEKQTPFTPAKTEIINLKDEQRGGNYGFFADETLERLRTALTAGNVFILANHRGSVSSVVCHDCGFVPRCPACKRPYSYHEDTKELVCHFCTTHKPMILFCENCRGTNLGARGIGTQKVERELRRKFKDILETLAFVRIDSDSEEVPVFDSAKKNIIIGTERALGFIDWNSIACTLLIDPDTLLFIPEYKITERLWQTVRAIDYASRNGSPVLIQTKHPEHAVFENLRRPERFYVKELQQRKFFEYPPFSFILKLSYGHTESAKAAMEAERLFLTLERLTKDSKMCTLTHPLATMPEFYKKRYWQVLLLKVDYRSYKRTIKELLKAVPEEWKVDPNPTSLLGF